MLIKNYTKVTEKEKNFFVQAVNAARKTGKFPWLKNIGDFEIYWCHDMNTNNGVLGAFSPIVNKKAVFLIPIKNSLKELASTVIHELYHMHQYQTYGFAYFALAVPGIRQLTIEPGAKKVELLYEKIFLT